MNAVWAQQIRKEKNHTLAFLYRYLPKKGDSLKIAASSVYRLHIDGKLTGYGPARAAHGFTRVDEYDLSAFAGREVVLCLEVFAANINTYYVTDELPFLAAEILSGGKVVAQAADFEAYRLTDRIQKVQKFSFQRAFVEVYDMKACRSRLYAGDAGLFPAVKTEQVSMNRLLPRNVAYPKMDFTPYRSVVECGKVTINPDAPLYRDRAFLDISDKLHGYTYDELDVKLSDEVSRLSFRAGGTRAEGKMSAGEYRTYDFGRTITGFADLQLVATRPTVLYITFDEVINQKDGYKEVNPFRNDCTNAIKFTLAPGSYHLTGFEPNSMHYAVLSVLEGEAEIESFCALSYENARIMAFDKTCGDPEIDAIVGAAKNTLAQNAVDVLTDCPSRERAGWLCDSFFSGRAEVFFDPANLVEYNFIENYLISPQLPQLEDGMLPMCYPADHYDSNYIPQWSMWFVLELQNYIRRTGNRELLKTAQKRLYNLIGCLDKYVNENGLLEDMTGWNFVEWSKCNDTEYITGENYPTNMLYAATLEAVGEMFGDKALIERAEKMRDTIRKFSFNGTFFEENRLRSKDGVLEKTGHLTETCQYYAFYFRVATPEDYPELFSLMVEKFGPMRDLSKVYPDVHPSNAIVGNSLRFEILYDNGLYEKVIQEGKYYFLPMVDLTDTLWEHNNPSHSLNHAFASYAAVFLTESYQKLQKKG